ncbi:transglycosylase SLT domain protein [Synechococcus sp. ROS8604]|nr:transglycosylase SLT domain protein [Synechococcus sp. ROS8604]
MNILKGSNNNMANVRNYIAAGNTAVRKNLKARQALADNKPDYGALGEEAIKAERDERIGVIMANAKANNASMDASTQIKGAEIAKDRDKSIAASKRSARKAGLLAGGALILGLANKERLKKDEPDLYQEMLQQQLLGRNQSITDLRTEIDEMRTDLENSTPSSIPTSDSTIPLSPESPGTTPISSAQSLAAGQGISNGGGSRYSVDQMQQLLVDRGMDPGTARQLAAVGMGESGGNPTIDTVQSGLDPNRSNEFSVGLFQINSQSHGDKLRRRGYTVDDLRDPGKNADIAIDVYNEAGGLTPWSVYNSGDYRQYMKL